MAFAVHLALDDSLFRHDPDDRDIAAWPDALFRDFVANDQEALDLVLDYGAELGLRVVRHHAEQRLERPACFALADDGLLAGVGVGEGDEAVLLLDPAEVFRDPDVV